MPKVEIDYSNTIIYKITCKDPSITDVYVGHTTNFVQRKHCHKQSCNNNNWIKDKDIYEPHKYHFLLNVNGMYFAIGLLNIRRALTKHNMNYVLYFI